MAVRLAADLRPSADGSAVRTSLVAGQLQAASVPIARLGQTHGRIATSLNTPPPLRRGITSATKTRKISKETHRRTGHFLEGGWIDFARKIWDSARKMNHRTNMIKGDETRKLDYIDCGKSLKNLYLHLHCHFIINIR